MTDPIACVARGFHVGGASGYPGEVKPLARTVAEAEELADATVEAKGLFMVAMCLRFWPQWAWLKEAVDTDRYGKVQAAHFQRIAEPPAWGQELLGSGAGS